MKSAPLPLPMPSLEPIDIKAAETALAKMRSGIFDIRQDGRDWIVKHAFQMVEEIKLHRLGDDLEKEADVLKQEAEEYEKT